MATKDHPPQQNTGPEQNEKIDLRILVADDEPGVRKMVEQILGRKYSFIETAENGQLVLDRLTTPGNNINLLITDINMPGISGLEVVKKIRKEGNMMPVIVLTGGNDSLQPEVEALGNIVFLTKPFRINQLYTAVTELMKKQK